LIWVPEINLFVAVGNAIYTVTSPAGQIWKTGQTNGSYNIYDVIYSSRQKELFGTGEGTG
jgi:hypothetical protein